MAENIFSPPEICISRKCLILSNTLTSLPSVQLCCLYTSQSYQVVSFTVLPGSKDVIVFPFHGQPTHRDCGLNSEQGFFSSRVSVGTYRHIQLPYLLNTERHLKSLNSQYFMCEVVLPVGQTYRCIRLQPYQTASCWAAPELCQDSQNRGSSSFFIHDSWFTTWIWSISSPVRRTYEVVPIVQPVWVTPWAVGPRLGPHQCWCDCS